MTTSTKAYTAQDLLELPRDGTRYELIEGELTPMAPAGNTHGKIAMALGAPMYVYCQSKGLGEVYAAETGFLIHKTPDTVLAPDVAFVRKERAATVDTQGYFPGAPDLAAEVVSPHDRYSEIEEKIAAWFKAGTHCVLIVHPQRRHVKVYASPTDVKILTEEETLELPDLLPGFTLPLAQLFQ